MMTQLRAIWQTPTIRISMMATWKCTKASKAGKTRRQLQIPTLPKISVNKFRAIHNWTQEAQISPTNKFLESRKIWIRRKAISTPISWNKLKRNLVMKAARRTEGNDSWAKAKLMTWAFRGTITRSNTRWMCRIILIFVRNLRVIRRIWWNLRRIVDAIAACSRVLPVISKVKGPGMQTSFKDWGRKWVWRRNCRRSTRGWI